MTIGIPEAVNEGHDLVEVAHYAITQVGKLLLEAPVRLDDDGGARHGEVATPAGKRSGEANQEKSPTNGNAVEVKERSSSAGIDDNTDDEETEDVSGVIIKAMQHITAICDATEQNLSSIDPSERAFVSYTLAPTLHPLSIHLSLLATTSIAPAPSRSHKRKCAKPEPTPPPRLPKTLIVHLPIRIPDTYFASPGALSLIRESFYHAYYALMKQPEYENDIFVAQRGVVRAREEDLEAARAASSRKRVKTERAGSNDAVPGVVKQEKGTAGKVAAAPTKKKGKAEKETAPTKANNGKAEKVEATATKTNNGKAGKANTAATKTQKTTTTAAATQKTKVKKEITDPKPSPERRPRSTNISTKPKSTPNPRRAHPLASEVVPLSSSPTSQNEDEDDEGEALLEDKSSPERKSKRTATNLYTKSKKRSKPAPLTPVIVPASSSSSPVSQNEGDVEGDEDDVDQEVVGVEQTALDNLDAISSSTLSDMDNYALMLLEKTGFTLRSTYPPKRSLSSSEAAPSSPHHSSRAESQVSERSRSAGSEQEEQKEESEEEEEEPEKTTKKASDVVSLQPLPASWQALLRPTSSFFSSVDRGVDEDVGMSDEQDDLHDEQDVSSLNPTASSDIIPTSHPPPHSSSSSGSGSSQEVLSNHSLFSSSRFRSQSRSRSRLDFGSLRGFDADLNRKVGADADVDMDMDIDMPDGDEREGGEGEEGEEEEEEEELEEGEEDEELEEGEVKEEEEEEERSFESLSPSILS